MGSQLAAKAAKLALEVVKDTTFAGARIAIGNLLLNGLFNHLAALYLFLNRNALHYLAGSFVSNLLWYAYGVLFSLGFSYAFLVAYLNLNLLGNFLANLNIYLARNTFGNAFHLGYFAFFPHLVGNPALYSLGANWLASVIACIVASAFAAIVLLEETLGLAKKTMNAVGNAWATFHFLAFPMSLVNALLHGMNHWLAGGYFLHDGAFFARLDPFTYSAGLFLHLIHPPVYIASTGSFFLHVLALVSGVLLFHALHFVNSSCGFIILWHHNLTGDGTGCGGARASFFCPDDSSRRGHEETRQQRDAGALPKHASTPW